MKPIPCKSVRFLGKVFAWWWCVLGSVAAAAAESPQPDLSISLRGLLDGAVEAGESFRVAVRVDAPENVTAKLELAPAKGSWIDATTVEILSQDGKVIPATSRPAIAANGGVSTLLDADNSANGLWWFPAESLGAVAPGDYVVRARLIIRDGPGWKGEAVSESAPLRVVAASSDPERVMQRKLGRARAAILAGEPAKAAEILSAMLEAEPNNVSALAMHAALSLEGGNRTAARACIERALILSRRPGEEPSAELNELAVRIEGPVAGGTVAGEVPIWTRIPRSVFEPVRKEGATAPALTPPELTNPRPAQVAAPIVATPPVTPAKPVTEPARPATVPVPVTQISSAKSAGVLVTSMELSDAKILADPAGQWAASATAGSQYDRAQYSAVQATGAPNIKVAGNSPDAWSPAKKNDGAEWLEVSFVKPVHATELRIRQNDTPGCIAKIEAIESDGTAHVWWEGVDPYVVPPVREIVWFAVRVPKTTYLVTKVKITLNLAAVSGWKEIDAVQLVGGD